MCSFGRGIVWFNKKQSEELKNIYELPLIRKMKLGDKFPGKLLHIRKSALRIGLVEPNTAMDSLALNLFLGNKRSEGELMSVIKCLEELSSDDNGPPEKVRKMAGILKYWKVGWI